MQREPYCKRLTKRWNSTKYNFFFNKQIVTIGSLYILKTSNDRGWCCSTTCFNSRILTSLNIRVQWEIYDKTVLSIFSLLVYIISACVLLGKQGGNSLSNAYMYQHAAWEGTHPPSYYTHFITAVLYQI